MKSRTNLQNQRQNVKVSQHQPVTVNYGENLPQIALGTNDKQVKMQSFPRNIEI